MNARQYAQRQAFGEQLRRLALHDPLTGLPNRRLLQERLAAALDTPSAGREIILVLFDLDRFKEINDSLGHGYGDTLLRRSPFDCATWSATPTPPRVWVGTSSQSWPAHAPVPAMPANSPSVCRQRFTSRSSWTA
jgi:hypothetical protein